MKIGDLVTYRHCYLPDKPIGIISGFINEHVLVYWPWGKVFQEYKSDIKKVHKQR